MADTRARRLLDAIQGRADDMVRLLERLVMAESPSTHPASHEPVRRILKTELEQRGFFARDVAAYADYRHIYARPAERRRDSGAQLIIGHYDTVWPVGTTRDRPFTVDGNEIRGPGVFDMKGGLAQLLIALDALAELDIEPDLVPLVFINADEEIGSRTSTRYIRLLAQHAERAYVLEPSLGEAGDLKTERKGIGRFTITVHGKAAHAGLDPEAGASAILELSHVIQKLFAMNDPARGISVNVGTVDGGIQPNVIAPHGSAVADVRVPSVADGDRIEAEILAMQAETPGVRLRVEGGIGRPSMEATSRNRALWRQAQAAGRELGLELGEVRAGGGSDGNTTSQYTATLDGLGPVGHGAHAKHEFLYVDRTLERAALLAMLLMAEAPEPAALEESA